MPIRTFHAGDEAAQVEIYNEAAADLPRFKPAAEDEVRRRTRAADFDPASRFYAVENGHTVGYATFHANGRVSYPWCRKGWDRLAAPLFKAVLGAMRERGQAMAFAAYRHDWPKVTGFFREHGFRQAREMVNFVVELADLPEPDDSETGVMGPLRPADLPAVLALAPQALRVASAGDLEKHLLHNPYFNADAVFVLRAKSDTRTVLGAGIVVEKPPYADPRKVDSDMPCFRLGAFGTEGMQAKRINGLFSFLVADGPDADRLTLDLLGHAVARMRSANVPILAAQAASDVPHLLRFYEKYCHRQGSFPMYERVL